MGVSVFSVMCELLIMSEISCPHGVCTKVWSVRSRCEY